MRGRPRIPEKWTRVISLEHQDLENLKTHIIATDLLLVSGFQGKRDEPQDEVARLHFFPKAFVKENKDISLEAFALEGDRLKELGISVTNLRKDILDKAEQEESKYEEDKEDCLKTIQQLGQRIQQRDSKSTRKS